MFPSTILLLDESPEMKSSKVGPSAMALENASLDEDGVARDRERNGRIATLRFATFIFLSLTWWGSGGVNLEYQTLALHVPSQSRVNTFRANRDQVLCHTSFHPRLPIPSR